jgi:hypothetical protein
MKNTFTYRYYFFNKNCTTMLLNLINDVLPENRQVPDRFSIDLPLNISASLFRSGIARFIYPEYWSISRQARFNSKKNQHIKEKLIDYFHRFIDFQKASEMEYYFQRVQDVTETRRASFYQKLFSLYLDCFNNLKYLEGSSGGAIFSKSAPPGYFQQGKLLLNFFMNAKERENYLAIVSISKKRLKSDESINLYQTPEMVALMASTLKLRHFLSTRIPQDIARINEEVQDELNQYTTEQRKTRSYRCGYSPAFISPGCNILDNRAYFSHAIKFATFFQNIGDNSVFSLGQDTYLEMLSVGASFKARIIKDPLLGDRHKIFYDTGFKLIDYKKILKRNEADYTGWWNWGFGLTLYDVYSDKTRGISRDTAFFNLRYIFNIFEKDNFKNHLNLEVGPGYSYRIDIEGQKRKFLDFFFRLNGQFHPFPNRLHFLRFYFNGRPRLNFKYYPILQVKTGLEAEWNFSAYSNTVLTTGIMYEKEFSRYFPTGIDEIHGDRISVYISYRINNKLLPGLGDLKELLNKLF